MRTALILALVFSASPALALTPAQWERHKATVDETVSRYEARCKAAETTVDAERCFDEYKAFLDRNEKLEAEMSAQEQRTADAQLKSLDDGISAARHQEMIEELRNSANSNQSYSCSYVGNGQSICNPQ